MLALETKPSGGKLHPHSDIRMYVVVFLGETSRSRQRGMKIGSWNFRSLYRAGSLKAAARELVRYKLDVVGVQEVRWDKRHTVRAEDCDFFTGKEMNIINLEQVFFVHPRIVSAMKRVEFVKDNSSYIVLRGH